MKRLSLSLLLLLTALSCPAQEAAPAPVKIDAAAYPTLQAALDAVPATGGFVSLPPGNYEITSPLVVKTPETRLEGAGASTHIINKNEAGEPSLILRPSNEKEKAARVWRIQVGNLRLSGNPKSGDGLLADRVQEIFLHGLSIDHHGGHGIHLTGCFEDPRVSDCILTYNKGSGLEIYDCHDIVVNANHFEENQDAVRCADSFNLCMNGNNVDDHLRHGVVIENTYGSVVSGNMIEECNGTAIILDRDCYGITLSANVIAHHLEGGIDLRDAWGCAVSANTFTIAHKFSVRVGKDAGRNSISANAFCNTYIGGGKDKRPAEGATPMATDEGTGVVLEGASDMLISGNTFTGLSSAAITADAACERVLATGNLAADCGRKALKGKPWFDLGQAKDSRSEGNLGEPQGAK